MGLTRIWEGMGRGSLFRVREVRSSHPPPASTRPPPSIETIYCPAVMQPVRTSFCPNGKRNPVPVAPAVFVEAFGNVAREASVLSLDVSQDLQ